MLVLRVLCICAVEQHAHRVNSFQSSENWNFLKCQVGMLDNFRRTNLFTPYPRYSEPEHITVKRIQEIIKVRNFLTFDCIQVADVSIACVQAKIESLIWQPWPKSRSRLEDGDSSNCRCLTAHLFWSRLIQLIWVFCTTCFHTPAAGKRARSIV